MNWKRRDFIKTVCAGGVASAVLGRADVRAADGPQRKPNVILCMTDDQGWGDTGYNGHPVIKTPNLDAMAREGVRFDRFYAAAPVCSPTRGSCLTGRHPYRYDIPFAMAGHIRPEEITLGEALKTQGYATGHFGKWHLGTLTPEEGAENRWGEFEKHPREHYSPPWKNGFDACFVTESKVPTWDPMLVPEGWRGRDPGEPFGNHYFTGPGEIAEKNLRGDDSRVIMDRALPFIRDAVCADTPFLAVIWFHAPHSPVVAGEKYRDMYSDQPENKQHFYGCVTAMDEQVGRLRRELDQLGVADNTMLWFCSDNGPARQGRDRQVGSHGPFRGYKLSLWEGGVRVPGLLVWPDRIKEPRVVDMACSTSDYYPTILDALDLEMEGQPRPIDGVSLMPLLEGRMKRRPKPIGFESGKQTALTDNRYKIISLNNGKRYQLFDLLEAPGEQHDLAEEKPEIVKRMKRTLEAWRKSCAESEAGADYKGA